MKLFCFFLITCLLICCKDEDQRVAKNQLARKLSIQKQIVLPAYSIYDVVKKLNGQKYADILIPSFNVNMNTDSLSKIAFAIIKKEGFNEASFYVNESAVKANFSNSFSKNNPGAFAKGYLGAIVNNKYIRE